MAALSVANADALVLGEIQVASHLGQPLSARIGFADISDAEVQQLTVRLAGIEEYRKLELQYPVGHKFHFQLVAEQEKPAFIHVATSYPLDDPFVDLLVEVASASGKLIKSYVFLLDPAQLLPPTALGEQAVQTVDQPEPGKPVVEQASKAASKADKPVVAVTGRPVARHKHPFQSGAAQAGSQMKLAMSLSISRYDPASPDAASDDALQEELIAKEKILEDMRVQLGAMQAVIKSLQGRLDHSVSLHASGVAESAVSAVAEAASAPSVAMPAAPVAAPAAPADEMTWLNPALALAVLLLGGALWYHYHKRAHAWQHGPFDEYVGQPDQAADEAMLPIRQFEAPGTLDMRVQEAGKPVEQAVGPLVGKVVEAAAIMPAEKASVGEESVEVAAYTGPESIVPPEYAMLMEANRYLRSGKAQLAEDALLRAIKANPKNAYGYLALLGIYQTRADAGSFATLAQQMKEHCDEAAYGQACEMGRKLDPENPLYS